MTWTLVNQDAVTFADGNGGHSYSPPSGAPSVGDLDILCVNSDTIVTTPSGFTLGPTYVGNQGAYLYYRLAVGGEGSSATVTTSGNFPTQLGWSRWQGALAADVNAQAHLDANNQTTTPAVSTGTLGGSGELVIAFAALHSQPGSAPASPAWSSGYTNLTSVSSSVGSDAHAAAGIVGYNTSAGAGSESPNVSWTNLMHDQAILVQTFTAAVGGTSANAGAAASSAAGGGGAGAVRLGMTIRGT